MVNSRSYQPPVDKLLTLGSQQLNYVAEFGFGSEQIPDLIKMAVDNELLGADTPELVWAPVHAWRTLGQLQATDAITPLIQLFQFEENDLVNEELPKVYGMIGNAAIAPLADYFASHVDQLLPRVTVINSLEEIANQHTDARDSVIAVLTHALQSCNQNQSELNGFIISTLINLQATEAAPIIKYAFNLNQVAEDIVGSWDEVKESLGISSDEEVPEFQPEALAPAEVSTPDVDPQSEDDINALTELTTEVTKTEASEIIPVSLRDESAALDEIDTPHPAPEVQTETINTEENIINNAEEAEEAEDVALEVKAAEPQVALDETPQVTVEDTLEVEATPEPQVTLEDTSTQAEELHQPISQDSIEPVSVDISKDISEESDATAQEDIKGFGRPATSKDKPEKQKASKKKKRGFADL